MILGEISPEMQAWIDSRPEVVRAMIAKIPPNRLYRLDGRSRVYPYSYNEDGTLTVVVDARFNACMFESTVFGIRPEQLVECDGPAPGEPIGVALADPSEIEAYCDTVRQQREDWTT